MGLLKKLVKKKKEKQSAAQTAAGEENHVVNNNDSPETQPETEAVKPQADPEPKEVKKKTADELVAEMFAKKDSPQPKPTVVAKKLDAEKLVAGMRISSECKMEEQKSPSVGKNIEQKKAIEALMQKQHDPKGFLDTNKSAAKADIQSASTSTNTFAQRKKMAEEMAQGKVATEEAKHTVDVSAEDFGDKISFAKRREMLEAKSKGQNVLSPTNAA